MSITILPATVADLPDIVKIYDAAFKTDRIIGQLMPNVTPEVKEAYDLKWYGREFDMSHLNGLHFYKALDSANGKVLGYAKWQYPHTLTSEQVAEKKRWDDAREEALPLPQGANVEVFRAFFGPLREKQKLWISPGTDYYLHILAVDPAHQRKGIGSLLIQRGLEDADKADAKAYIEASPAGLPLYVKFGWVQVDKVVVDIGKIDGKGLATEVCLVREPQGAGIV